MTVNPTSNAVELTPDEIRRAVAFYLKQKTFGINCRPENVKFDSLGAEVVLWDNEPVEEEMFLVNP